MKRERSQVDKDIIFVLNENENVIAYCENCRTPVFVGDDKTNIKKAILKERIQNHLNFFDGVHVVNVVFPRKKNNNMIDGNLYVKRNFIFEVVEKARPC